MPRPVKWRRVEFIPGRTYFIPLGKPKCEIHETILKIEELEAIRLKDIERLTQEECAERMQVSRQTFQNIIDEARRKVTTALIEGNAINISGGNYIRNVCEFKCLSCNNVYLVKYEEDKHNCPKCGSKEVLCSKQNSFCRRACNRTGR